MALLLRVCQSAMMLSVAAFSVTSHRANAQVLDVKGVISALLDLDARTALLDKELVTASALRGIVCCNAAPDHF